MADTITDSAADAGTVVRTYFNAVAARDVDAMAACWQAGGSETLVGLADLSVPDGLKAYFGEIFAAFPDFDFQVEQFVEAGDTVTVRWSAAATFAGPGSFMSLSGIFSGAVGPGTSRSDGTSGTSGVVGKFGSSGTAGVIGVG